MQNFLRRSAIFLITFSAILVAAPTSDIGTGYITAYKSHIQPGEIQFIGGSNLCFGLKSDALDKHISKTYASYGFHGATGLEFHLQQLDLFSESTTIFSPPLEWIDNSLAPHLYAEVLSYFPPSVKSLTPIRLIPDAICARTINLLRLFRKRRLLNPQTDTSKPSQFEWSNAIVDKHGFIYSGLRPNNFTLPKKLHVPPRIDSNSWAKAKDKIDFILPPPIAESNGHYIDDLSAIFNELNAQIGSNLLLSVESCVLPDSLFGDDQYHLNEMGADRYSDSVGKAIQQRKSLSLNHALQ